MKKLSTRCVLAMLSALSLGAGPIWAQTAPKEGTVPVEKTDEEVIELSPFVVTADEDVGYLANATMVGGRTRTDLKDIASAISVVTAQFLSDTKANDNQSLLKYTTNTEVGGIYGNYAGIGNTFINGAGESAATLIRPNGNTRVRGLDSADNLRDLVKTDIPWNGFNVGRVDFQRGANSILFGLGSPAGLINASTNTAGFKNGGNIENQIGSFGSMRNSLDFNYVLIPKTLAIRLDAVYDHQMYRQEPAYNRNRSVYGALRWDPKLFGENSTARTSVRVNYEHGKVDANRPHSTPPGDKITPWFDPNGLNKRLVEPNYDYQTGLFPWNGGTHVSQAIKDAGLYQKANNWLGTSSLWSSNPSFVYNNNSTPVVAIQGSIDAYYAPGHTTGFPFSVNPGIEDFGGWAKNVAQYGADQGLTAAEMALAAGGLSGFYKTKSITDPGIFDFYNNLLDGPTKKEWQGWEAYSVSAEQTFFNDRLGFQFVYDHQEYSDGGQNILGWSPNITVDIAQYGPIWGPAHPNKAELNPNAGRVYLTGTGGGNSFDSERDSFIFTGRGELKASDFMDGKSQLARILGHHTLTGVYNTETYKTESRSWNLYAASEAWADLIGNGKGKSYDGQVGRGNGGVSPINNVIYLTDAVTGFASASQIHIPRIMNDVQPAPSVAIRYFDAHWKWPTNPADPAYVNPADPWTNPSNIPNVANDSNQGANPQNLVGWQTATVPIFSAARGDINQLWTNASKIKHKITSKAGTWQAYFWDDAIVATVGYRNDRTETRAGKALVDSATKKPNMNYGLDPLDENGIDDGTTTSWGVVARLPRSMRGKLPWGTDVALAYSYGKNTRVENRFGFSANRLPNTRGLTKDISLAVTMLDDRLSIKATHYDTLNTDANISSIGGPNATLGNATSNIYNQEAWGVGNAMMLLAGMNGDLPGWEWFWNWSWARFDGTAYNPADWTTPYDNKNVVTNVAFQNDPTTLSAKAAVASWLAQMKPQSWYDLYGYPINVAKAKAGDYMNAVAGWVPNNGSGIGGADGTINGQYPTGTIDNRSTGWEFEVTGKPIKNLDVSFNASKQFARQVSLGADLVNYIESSYVKYMSPAGDLRQWWAGDDSYRKVFLRSVWSAYQFQAQTNGKMVSEMSPWRANLSATYRFDSGRLKGGFVGGSYRWQQGTILGYGLNAAQDNLDVEKPIWGKSRDWVDIWAGYEWKISEKLRWRTQVNLRNVGQKPHLTPISVQPDGSPAQYRIEEGITWTLSNTLSF